MTEAPEPIDVLVVEDDATFAKQLAATLGASTQGSFRVEAAGTLEEGLERISGGEKVDVLLLDLELPGTTGLATLDRVVAERPELAVVVLTGTTKGEQTAVEAVRRGAEDYIFKGSVGQDVLARSLRYALERRRASLEIRRQTEELARSNRDLRQFAGAASHDLQEPLRTIGSYLELLRERYGSALDEQGRELLQIAIEAAERSRALVRDLLQLSHVTTRGRPFVPCDLNAVLASVRGDLARAIAEAGATITSEDLPTVLADEAQLRAVLSNLVSNSLKYRSAEPPRIEVGARREGGEWIVWVRDNGIGIDPTHHDRIFEVFERLHSRTRYHGTGIGLAIVRRIVERHGGRVWVDSQEGEGATFSLSLPRFGAPADGASSGGEEA